MRVSVVGVLLASVVVAGCTTSFREVHYFKSTAGQGSAGGGTIPNYYRLEVTGSTLFSNCRYVSGYYDEETVDEYFNEFSQPAHGSIRTSSKAGDQKNSETVAPLDPKLEGRSLVMILSSNSDDISNQIGALAANKEFTASLAALMAGERFAAANDAEARLSDEQARSTDVSAVVKAGVDALRKADTPLDVEDVLVGILNKVAADLGHSGAFSNLKEAEEWLKYNRSRITMEQRP